MLSKSKYCNAIQCNKLLWLNENKAEEAINTTKDSVLDNGVEVGNVAKDLFGKHIDIEYNPNLDVMVEDTKKALEQENVVVCEASFIYDNNFCSVDVLKKNGNDYEIYEVKSSTDIADIYFDDIAYQVYVLKHLGINVTKAYIAYINNEYVRHGDLELNKLFNIEDVTEISNIKQEGVEAKIAEINKYMEKEEQYEEIGLHCTKPYDCPFFHYCTSDLPENNVFKIRRMLSKKKFELYNRGIYSFEDLLKTDIDKKFKQQIEYELYDKEDYINKEEVKEFMKGLYYPLYFLDFETFQQPIPQYDDIRPYMQIPFQYSLHYIEEENSKLGHKEFLAEAGIDPRRKLAERLVNDIPLDACTLAYNMSFEKTVIKNLANLYPDLAKHLMNIHDNMQDLMIPFKDRHYYTKAMQGSFSIKYVLPALFPNDPALDYHNLNLIHNGGEAMSSFANLTKMTKEEQEEVRYNLLRYCELDTYAMVKIWERLNEVIDKEVIYN